MVLTIEKAALAREMVMTSTRSAHRTGAFHSQNTSMARGMAANVSPNNVYPPSLWRAVPPDPSSFN